MLTGKVEQAVNVVKLWLEAGAADGLKFTKVAQAIGSKPHAFRNEVRQHPHFIDTIAELGVVESGKGVRNTEFAMASKT